jgi:hypothetical protein
MKMNMLAFKGLSCGSSALERIACAVEVDRARFEPHLKLASARWHVARV